MYMIFKTHLMYLLLLMLTNLNQILNRKIRNNVLRLGHRVRFIIKSLLRMIEIILLMFGSLDQGNINVKGLLVRILRLLCIPKLRFKVILFMINS